MKKIALLTLLMMIMSCTVHATDLQGLTDKFRIMIAEIDTVESWCTDSIIKIWHNLSQAKIVPMGGYIERVTKFAYADDSTRYALPSTFKRIKDVWLKSEGEWYALHPNIPQTQESKVSKYGVSWISPDSAEIRIIEGEVVATYTDFVFSEDSIFYTMPADYEKYLYATYWTTVGYKWFPVFENVGFNKDTLAKNGYVFEKHPDTNLYFFKGNLAVDEDTVRVAYMRTLTAGDTIEVQYYGEATELVALTDESDVPTTLEVYVLEEMFICYLRAKKEYNAANSEWEKLRIDMGILKPKE